MNSSAFSKTPNLRCPTPNAQCRAVVIVGALFFALSPHDLHAQVGNQNPGGASGIFNGQVHTGCSYDPYTGNATRSITDIAVAGAVGEYPLALVRTANSRTPSTTEIFGFAGGWNHNYNWILEDSPTSTTANFHPKRYTVDFPDGRVETFRAVTWDSVYRVRRGADMPAQSTSAGVRERFVPLNTSTMYAYLVLPDGGAVEFTASQHVANNHYYYKYHATAIYDPYGLKTTLIDEVVANGTRRRLIWVIDPSGQRNLHFFYVTTNGPRIGQIDASDGRTVQYYYIYCNGCRLDRVRYYNNPAWDARYQYCNSNVGQGLPPLLWTADDPMYSGAMKRIAYQYKIGNNPDGNAAVYGQILRERYWDGVAGHETSGAFVSELTVGSANPINHNIRTEKRGDNVTRTFTYNGAGYVTWVTDFMSHSSTYGYDSYKYRNSFIDFNRNETDYTCDPITGNITQIKFPLTPGDTPGQGNTQPTINYTYTNSYYLHTVQDESSHSTTFTRNVNNRVTRIDYPAGGYETFTYDADHFYQLSSHRMIAGGTETFTYDGSNRLQYYSDPYHSNPSNPSIQYFYDGHAWVSGVLDALGHPTNWDYNDRGQVTVTTLVTDPVDHTRHTITNAYNPDGTLQRRTDELSHITSYTYDDYRRVKSVTPPLRGFGDNGTYTTNLYYDANGTVDDYRYTDSNATYVKLPGGKKAKTVYDDNRRNSSVTAGYGSGDEATVSYGYDGVGNVTRVTNLRNRITTTVYDERNRPSEVHDPLGNITSFTYDTAGRKKTVNRPNGQVITNASFDEMNRVLQQNVTQTPDPLAVTKYTYYPSGLLNTVTDPHNSTDSYTYTYDLMGRKQNVTYPADLNGNHWTEHFTYDAAGRLDTFKNRKGNVQTFHYDVLNRLTYFTWDDNLTPRVDFSYDAASRLTEIDNVNATVARAYFNDNLLRSETEVITGGRSKQVAYTYNADGGRANITYPDYQAFAYTYTGRNQVKTVGPWATYTYDENGYVGDLTTRTLNNGNTQSTYLYDSLDRVTWITHALSSGNRGFNYGYDDVSVGNCKYIRRTGTTPGNKGDVFTYDLADQVSGVQLNVTSPQSTPSPPRSIYHDANGNRTTFRPYGTTDTYATNNLNQYTSRNSNNASYDANGNMIGSPDPAGSRSTYTYDAQNRLLTATKSGVTDTFAYDGLNRQVGRTVGGATVYNVWDGWDLIEEYPSGGTPTAKYVYGPGGLVKELVNNRYYYHDGSGSTSHLADGNGSLLEWYRYDLQGTPFFYAPNDTPRSTSNYAVRHLFTGQQWYGEIGLYDLRNRFYSPDIGRFLQPDPIGFRGDRTNLYRYCGNNPATRWDPFGLWPPFNTEGKGGPTAEVDPVIVTGGPVDNPSDHPSFNPMPALGPGGFVPSMGSDNPEGNRHYYNPFPRPREDDQPSVEHPPPSSVPPQNPQQPVSAPVPGSPSSPSAPAAGVFSLWQQMLITAFNDPIGDHDNRLGPGDIATADLRYRPTDFDNRNRVIRAYGGLPLRAYPRGSSVTIYRQDGTVYTGAITDTGAGFAAHRPDMGLPNGVPGTLWFDIWTPSGSEDPEWDLVLIQTGQ